MIDNSYVKRIIGRPVCNAAYTYHLFPRVEIYKRKQESKKGRKHAFHQEKKRKHDLDQLNKILTRKKERKKTRS